MQQRTIVEQYTGKRYAIPSVVKIERTADGSAVKTVLSKPKKRRVSRRWRGLDKALRRVSVAGQTASSEYLKRHERSNEKKKNGAVRDLLKNSSRAQRKGFKKLKLFKI